MTGPTVSIIIPLYNAASTLRETLESVYAQTFKDWELIIFDDGSDDLSAEIGQVAASARSQVRYLRHSDGKNRGPAATRNRAVESATGKYVAFLDADDVWLDGMLDARVQSMDAYPQAAMVWGPAEYFGPKIEAFKQPTGLSGSQAVYEPPAMVEALVQNIRGAPCPSGALLRRDVFNEVRGFEEGLRRGEDIALWVKVAASYTILYDDRIWLRYRRHDESSTSRSARGKTKESWELEFYRWLLDFVYANSTLNRMQSVVEPVENDYHSALQNWAGRSGWLRSRLQVSKGLSSVPKLLNNRWWCLLLDWIFPFRVSRRVVGKVQSWGALWQRD